jgi:HEAT repeat protein
MDGQAVAEVACAIVGACWIAACAGIVLSRLLTRRRDYSASVTSSDGAPSTDWPLAPDLSPPASDQGALDDPDARDHLERGLRSSEPEVRRASVSALGRLGQKHDWAIDALLEALAERRDVPARVAAELDRLAPRADARLAPLLEHPNSVVRYYAARLLARDGKADGGTAPDLTGDPSPHVRAAGLQQLRRQGTGAALRRSLRMLDDTHPRVRAEACRTASQISAGAVAPFVAPLLADPSWEARDAALQALVHAGGQAVAVVVPLLEHEDPTVASLAAQVLRDVGYLDEVARPGVDAATFERPCAAGGRRFHALAGRRYASTEPDVSKAPPEAAG